MSRSATRPVLNIPISPLERTLEIAAILGLGYIFYITITNYPILPPIVPTHFGFSGKPDGWGSRETVRMLPIVVLISYIMLSVVSRFPQIYNFPVEITEENAERQYTMARQLIYWMKALMIWLFAYLQWATMQAGLGRSAGINGVFMLALTIAMVAIPIGYVFKSRRER